MKHYWKLFKDWLCGISHNCIDTHGRSYLIMLYLKQTNYQPKERKS